MVTFFAVPIACWCCALVLLPRRSLLREQLGDAVLVQRLGRHQQVVGLAMAATVVALVAVLIALPSQPDAALSDLRLAHATCGHAAYGVGVPTCFDLQPGGGWEEEERQGDGRWVVVGTMPHLPARAVPTDNHDGIRG